MGSTRQNSHVFKTSLIMLSSPADLPFLSFLRTFIGVETAALTFRTKQYSTSYSSPICYGKRFYNDFFLNHHTIALVTNFLKLLSGVVIETVLDLVKKKESIILTVSFQLENVQCI